MRLHISPRLNGRHLSAKQRAAMLMREGETWLNLSDLAELRYRGDRATVVTAVIWHGEYGSILRGPSDHVSTCAPASDNVLNLRGG